MIVAYEWVKDEKEGSIIEVTMVANPMMAGVVREGTRQTSGQ